MLLRLPHLPLLLNNGVYCKKNGCFGQPFFFAVVFAGTAACAESGVICTAAAAV